MDACLLPLRRFVTGWRRTVEREEARPSFSSCGRLRGRRRALLRNRPERAGFSRLVQLRRLAWFFVGGLVAAAGLGGAADKFIAPPAAPEPAHRFDVAVGRDAQGPHAVDYQRLDQRLQRIVEDPAMVGLAVGIVENGQSRVLKGYGRTFAGGSEPGTPNTL